MKGTIAEFFAKKGVLIDPDAAKMVMGQRQPIDAAKAVISELSREPKDAGWHLDPGTLQVALDKIDPIIIAEDADGGGGPDGTGSDGTSEPREAPEDGTEPPARKPERPTKRKNPLPEPSEPPETPLSEQGGEELTAADGVPASIDPPDPEIGFERLAGYDPEFRSSRLRLKVLRDITGQSLCEGKKKDFIKYFSDRFNRLKDMLRRKPGVGTVIPIDSLKKRKNYMVNRNEDVSVIGLVSNIRSDRSGNVYGVDMEDPTGRLECRFSRDAGGLDKNSLVLDEVAALVGDISRNRDLFYIRKIVRPNVSWMRRPNRAKENVCAAFISDIHFGSKTFLEREWVSFLGWINGASGMKLDLVNRIKYLVIAGDNVDGIGIYPDQRYDLAIMDISKQYEILAKYIEMIPDHIRIIMIPGNHDAVRQAEPQPALDEEIRKFFPSNVEFLGNPALFELHGVGVLAYHGASIDDWTSVMVHLDYTNPIESMEEMLIRRHILPMYGMKTPLAPEKDDHLIIDRVPDIFVTGHTHSFGAKPFRKVLMVNGSTWQSQTDYQKRHNFDPVPAKVTVVDLSTFEHAVLDFMGGEPVPFSPPV